MWTAFKCDSAIRVVINNYWIRFLRYPANNQGRGKGYQPQPAALSCFCFFTDRKQHKVSKLDMTTLRNHEWRSYTYMT